MPVDEAEPTTLVGLRVTDTKPGGVIVSAADALTPPAVPLMVAVVLAATAVVFTVKPADVLPEPTVTLAGTVAAFALDESLIVTPASGAALVSVTVPAELTPPATAVGFKVKVARVAVSTVSTAVLETPANTAVIVADAGFGTEKV